MTEFKIDETPASLQIEMMRPNGKATAFELHKNLWRDNNGFWASKDFEEVKKTMRITLDAVTRLLENK